MLIEPTKTKHVISIDRNGKYVSNAASPSDAGWKFEIERYAASGLVNEDNKLWDVGQGWVPRGGIVLRNVFHKGHRLAYEIGVVGIVVMPGAVSKKNGHGAKYLILGPPDFVQVDASGTPLTSGTNFDPLVPKATNGITGLPGNFSVFDTDHDVTLMVRWRSNLKLYGSDSDYLWVTQKYILTKYDNNPAHEPTGGLMAARLHPLVELKYGKPNDGWVASFRVDYRMQLSLNFWLSRTSVKEPDSFLGIPTGTKTTVVEARKTTSGKLKNAAGVFADNDVVDVKGALDNGIAGGAFRAAEKPLVAEILTSGYNTPGVKINWDNVHWWGAGENWIPASAPGSFHAIHMHWRWAKFGAQFPYPPVVDDGITYPNPLNAPAPHVGEKQFSGPGYGGALVDPGISNQAIRIAVVANQGLPADMHKHRSESFDTFFEQLATARKVKIDNGEELVLYYSAEIPLPKRSRSEKENEKAELKGTVCIHGLYFAHDPEPDKSLLSIVGATGKLFLNPTSPVASELKRYPAK